MTLSPHPAEQAENSLIGIEDYKNGVDTLQNIIDGDSGNSFLTDGDIEDGYTVEGDESPRSLFAVMELLNQITTNKNNIMTNTQDILNTDERVADLETCIDGDI